jgi:hypothetical protein
MTRDEHKQIVNRLLGMVAPDHQANASELLTNLSEDYEQTLTASETATTRVEELTKNNETLRDVNAKLFLKVGSVPNEPQPSEPKTEPERTPISIDSLFNEKGELI